MNLTKLSLKARIVACVTAILILEIVSIGYVYISVNNKKTDSVVINDAGKLRMLSQKIAKATYMMEAGNEKALDELVATANVFSNTFDGVRYGNEERGITPPPPSLTPQINVVNDIWEKYKKNVDILVSAVSSADEKQHAMDGIGATNISLLKESNNLVQLFEKEAQSKVTLLMQTLLITLGLSIAIFVLTLIVLVRSLRPIKDLVDATSRVESGDMEVNIKANSHDELGQLCHSFNNMTAAIRSAQNATLHEKESVMAEKQRTAQIASDVEAERNDLMERIRYMLDRFDRFAGGDLTVKLEIDASKGDNDPMNMLFNGFNSTVNRLSILFQEIQHAISNATGNVTHIASATEELSAGVHEQTTQMTQAATRVERVTSEVIELAKEASQSASFAEGNGKEAGHGGEIVKATVQKIQDIARIVGSSADKVEQLGNSSKEISHIVSTINEIADQTNLLALNAAIEAARAGEQGRGFAVVADEVRALAERTTEATTQIAEMITSIQKETAKAVESMQLGTKEVQQGLSLADDAGKALEKVVGDTSHTVDLIGKVAAGNHAQSENCQEVAFIVHTMATTVEQSSQAIEDIAVSTNTLNTTMEQIDTLVRQFKTQSTYQHATV